jgi:hypothetical protein
LITNLFPNSNGQLQPIGIINASTVPNPGLRPMRVSEKEFGLELKFLDNRVGLDVAFYDKSPVTRSCKPRSQTLQAIQTQDKRRQEPEYRRGNAGKSGTHPTSDFEWSTSFNGSYNESEVLKLLTDEPGSMITMGDGVYIGELRQVVGRPLGQLYGWGIPARRSGPGGTRQFWPAVAF